MLEGRICGLRIPKAFFSNRFRVARMGVSVLSVVLRGTRGVGGRKIVKLQIARYCTDRTKCDIIAANMGGSAITLSRVCAIFPARRLAAAAALLLLAPISLFGRELDFRGQKVTVEGLAEGDWEYVGGAPNSGTEELILVFKDTASAGTLSVPYGFEARMLLVGGGGAGGYGTTGTTNPGGGGGGGEVVYLENAGYDSGTYTITIGAGGAQTTAAGNGENGHPSFVTGVAEISRALGGGGGGAKEVGNGGDGVATGGGGGGSGNDGGVGKLGVEHKGGKATRNNRSGGGGGAGGFGDDSTTDKGGDGGAGKEGLIWADVSEDILPLIPRRYGGGGGGGQSSNYEETGAGSGKDGGGLGGYRNGIAENGASGTGGGGGGGGRCTASHESKAFTGGAGGSGIVIIRITYIEIPMTWKEVAVTGAGGISGTIFVDENAATKWVDGDLVITYSNTTARGGLRFFDPSDPTLPPVWAQARSLAVGGGGGGGMINVQAVGAGAGGGAGGLLEESGFLFSRDVEYSIVVGRGGAGGKENEATGGNGGNSSVKTNGVSLLSAEAVGGGGGGAHCEGLEGGSGGGGSRASTKDERGAYDRLGGAGVPGQGLQGGEGAGTFYAAGGGGAGEVGGDASSSVAGSGGKGKEIDITGSKLFYAGGGGGAGISPAAAGATYKGGAGGAGGGGAGAGVKDGVVTPAENGADGFGGGGGGGVSYVGAPEVAGDGGSGIVIIRLSHFVVSQVPIPPTTDYVYDGNVHTGVVELFTYTFTTPESSRIAKNADVYTVTATIAADAPWEWVGGGRGDRTVTWKISPLKVDVPTWGTDSPRTDYFVFGNSTRSDEEEKLAIDGPKWRLRTNRTSYPGETCATTNKWGEELPYCTLTGHRETNASEYKFTATLVSNDPQGTFATNFVWRNSGTGRFVTSGQETASPFSDTPFSVEVDWKITQAENAIKTLSIANWQEGTTNKMPSSTWQWSAATARYPNPDNVEYQWRLTGTEDWSPLRQTFDPPTDAGVYDLRAYICKDSNYGNWTNAEKIVRFTIWRHPSKSRADWVEIRPTGCTLLSASSLADFPVLVRLREPTRDATGAVNGGLPGFRYADVGRNGLDLRFLVVSNLAQSAVAPSDLDNPFARDSILPFEIDTWDPNGESLVWVKIPKLYKDASFRMYWRLRDGASVIDDLPASDTWANGYVGVWHLNEAEGPRNDTFRNSTVHGSALDATGKVDFVESKAGKAALVTAGNLLAPNYQPYMPSATSPFTMTGWYRGDKYQSGGSAGAVGRNNYMFAGKKFGGQSSPWTLATGWCLNVNNNVSYLLPYESGNNNMGNKTVKDMTKNWMFVGFKAPVVGSSATMYCYFDNSSGVFTENNQGSRAVYVNDLPFQLAGQTFAGDEVRLSSVARTKDWVQAEHDSVNNAKYCTFGLVNQLQGDGTRAWVNWWSAEPWTTLRATPDTEGGRYWRQSPKTPFLDPMAVTNDFGQLAKVFNYTSTTKPIGTVLAVYTSMPSGGQVTFPTDLGPYDIRFTMSMLETGTFDFPGRHVLFEGDRLVRVEIIEEHPEPIDPDGPEGATFSGRVLTANDDTNAAHAVALQSYWREPTDDPSSPNPYWEHNGASVPEELLGLNLQPYAGHTLNGVFDGGATTNVLWTLSNVYIGNMMTNDAAASGNDVVLSNRWNTLPWSPTSVAISAPDEAFDHTEVGQLVMRNIEGAEIRSGVFTNGVGTVYFDAVNAYALADLNPGDYQLVVEYAPAEDETWTPVALQPLKVEGTTVTTNGLGRTEVLSCLDVKNGGKVSSFAFYRVCAKIGRNEPTRIRIRRVSALLGEDFEDNPDGFIAIDNIVVSWPTQSVRLESSGTFDRSKRGKRALGMEKACSVDYPTPYETGLFLTANYTGTLPPEKIQSVRCHYRWRYLNTRFDPEFLVQAGKTNDAYEVVYIDTSTFRTRDPLKLNGHVGDIEYWFDLTATVPYYEYVDYSGSGLGLMGFYTEELPPGVESHFEDPGVLPSCGKDWFVRLREGRDPYGSVTLRLTDGPLAGDYPMHLAEDNTWKCHVLVPARKGGTEVEGTCGFHFRNDDTGETFHPADARVEFPAKGSLVPGSQPTTFVIDHAATCIEFRFNDRYSTFAAMRAEYQTFNEWSDAHSPLTKPAFFASAVDTNGVNIAAMESYPAPIATWKAYVATNTAWEETFYLPSYDGSNPDDAYKPRDEVFPSHTTPNGWEGANIAFVQEVLGGSLGSKAPYNPYPAKSGMAGKLLGQGRGRLEYTLGGKPDGLERVTFKARVGQSIEFENFAWSTTKLFERDYMFTTLANMSHMIALSNGNADDNAEHDMAAGGSMSMIAYYFPSIGFYEFRVERIEQGARVMMSLWKWHNVNGAMKAECLVKRRMESGIKLWTNNNVWRQGESSNTSRTEDSATVGDRGPKNPQYRLMFITVKNEASSTKIYGGISSGVKLPYSNETTENSFNKMSYSGLYFEDTEGDHLTFGSYGVAAKDCPAEFLKPKHGSCAKMVANMPVSSTSILRALDTEVLVSRDKSKGRFFRTNETNTRDIGAGLDELTSDEADIFDAEFGSRWALPTNRVESFANDSWAKYASTMRNTHRGLRVPPALGQKVIVELQDASKKSAAWVPVATNTVTGYGFQPVDVSLYLKGQYNMRLTTGSEAIDVVVDDVRQTQWMGEDGSNPGKADVFLYTQGHVVTNTAEDRMEIELVPSRAHVDRALSIRSPVINGLGKITFAYANADTNTEIWVQMATNAVDNLTGGNGYNDSVRSVEFGQQQQIGEWVTLAKYSYAGGGDPELRLGKAGWKTVYVGLHDNKEHPLRGIFRLFVPTNVVAYTDTRTSKELDRGDKDHGRVSITELWVSNEPALDARSWRGWNLRTIGDDRDTERRMYLADLVSESGDYGLVGALNNSIIDAIDKNTGQPDDEKTRRCNPTIWSPTLGSYTNAQGAAIPAGVGEMTFRARLYGDDVEIAPAKVTLYGSEVGSLAENWDRIEEFEITSPYFTNISWKASDKTYTALRLEVSGDWAKTRTPKQDRVILDEITICERVKPSLSFVYASPFRTGLDNDLPITDYASREQQPLAGENWGVQTQLRLQQLGDEVDLSRGIEVSVAYTDVKPSAADWGYEQWADRAKGEVKLVQVGDASNLVFRSVGAVPESVMPPSPEAGTVVQFMVKVTFHDKGGATYGDRLYSWTQPAWYHPVDYNRQYPGFSPYTILDAISPGRAWINEVQWNNGSRTVTHTDDKVTDNQFMEVCVPSGLDMSGWKVRAYDRNGEHYDIATFGTLRVASSKTSGRAVSGYEFFVLMSPETQKAGKLRDAWGGAVDPDGVWSMTSDLAGVDGGTFSFSQPYAFELIRPSGVIEHSFTIDGTNDWGTVRYDATNLLAVLNEMDHSPSRFYAGREQEKNINGGTYAPKGTTYGSSGVVGEQGTGNGPGSEGTWVHGLDFTVGSRNPGQVIPADWLLAPNGTNTWVYFTVVGDHISQKIGKGTNRTELVILPQGASTNVIYSADPWWEVLSVAVDGVETPVHLRGRDKPYLFSVPEGSGSRVNVVATEGVDSRLDEDRFKLKGQRYRNAVLNWLGQEKWKDKTPDDIRFARMAQLRTPVATHAMTLIDMYWLDICPFNSEGSTFEPTPEMDPLSSEWVLRAGFTDYAPNAVTRVRSGEEILNSVFKVKMFITNEFTHAVYAPYTLQGIGNERSCDGNWSGNSWTSETFKINGKLNVNLDSGFNKGFLPFREFVFYPGSFAPATAGEGTRTEGGVPGTPGAFEAVIELTDPFSGLSTPGVSYGWWRWPRSTSAFFNWRITHTNASPMSVEYLMPQSTYNP